MGAAGAHHRLALGFGSGMVIYLAGLQGIPEVFYEAADIDGAGGWAKLRHITIPLVSPVIFFNLIIGIIASFQVFIIARLITNGGPQNATLVYVLYMYQNAFANLKNGLCCRAGLGVVRHRRGLDPLCLQIRRQPRALRGRLIDECTSRKPHLR